MDRRTRRNRISTLNLSFTTSRYSRPIPIWVSLPKKYRVRPFYLLLPTSRRRDSIFSQARRSSIRAKRYAVLVPRAIAIPENLSLSNPQMIFITNRQWAARSREWEAKSQRYSRTLKNPTRLRGIIRLICLPRNSWKHIPISCLKIQEEGMTYGRPHDQL